MTTLPPLRACAPSFSPPPPPPPLSPGRFPLTMQQLSLRPAAVAPSRHARTIAARGGRPARLSVAAKATAYVSPSSMPASTELDALERLTEVRRRGGGAGGVGATLQPAMRACRGAAALAWAHAAVGGGQGARPWHAGVRRRSSSTHPRGAAPPPRPPQVVPDVLLSQALQTLEAPKAATVSRSVLAGIMNTPASMRRYKVRVCRWCVCAGLGWWWWVRAGRGGWRHAGKRAPPTHPPAHTTPPTARPPTHPPTHPTAAVCD